MSEKELNRKYKSMLLLNANEGYDGRGKGVDVYTCDKCGKQIFTRYKDKGVTPFTIACREKGCCGTMMHKTTIHESEATERNATVINWVRPSLEWVNKQRKKGRDGLVEHIHHGGLMMENEI